MKKITIGVIGAGRIGKLHVENIKKYFPQIYIKSISDPKLDMQWAESQNIPNKLHETDSIFTDSDINAVLICSPAPLHVPQIIAAARAGKHVFCEKPIATDVESIMQALHEVEKANIIFQVGFNRRFDPNFAKIKHLLQENHIGQPHLIRITSRDPEIPPVDYLKTSSGMFLDMTIHDFDMARFLMNSEIIEVYATGAALIDPTLKEYNDIDTAIINLKFANGCLGVIDNSRQATYGYDQRVEVFGSLGAVHTENNKPTNTIISTQHGVVAEKPLRFFLERYKESYINEMQEFYDSIIQQKTPSVSGRDGLLSIVVALAARDSMQLNKPIKINYAKWNKANEDAVAI